MTFLTHRAPRLAVAPPAVRQPGPVTLAIRGLRPNSLPSWEMRQQQIEDERRALRELRERIANRIEADIALLDRLDRDVDLEDGADDEPSLCNSEGQGLRALEASTYEGDDREFDAGDDGLGDYDGLAEQGLTSRFEVFA